MGLRIIKDESEGYQVMICTTTMVAFGPVHYQGDFDLVDFVQWLPQDARRYSQEELYKLYYQWIEAEKLLQEL